MGYLHIDNLYRNQTILMFKQCWALEKIHGTSAHVGWDGKKLKFFSGGASYPAFVALFNQNELAESFQKIGHDNIHVFGEAYGGKMQAMSKTYGPDLRFIAFDVKVGECWLDVPDAMSVCESLGIEFVDAVLIPATIESIDAEKMKLSSLGIRRGMGEHMREGVVLRPIVEMFTKGGDRVIAKHKRDEFRETATPRAIDPEKQKMLDDADAIALEWVTDMRLFHVLDKMGNPITMEKTKDVVIAMTEDIEREAQGEIITGKETRKAIGKRTAQMFKKLITTI